ARPSLRLMALAWEQVVIETADAVTLGQWWAEALGWAVVDDGPIVFGIQPTPGQVPGILFLQSDAEKQKKNRLHLDFRPDDQAAEVERLIGMGARRIDVGQGDVPWVVLADPDGNEFCILGGPH
ncbi:MAG: VOC family protein, partial [Actinomycetota bacterium]